MSNPYWNHTTPFVAGSLVRAETANAKFDGIAVGFDLLNGEHTLSLKMSTGFTGNTTLPNMTVANKVLYFDANGDLALYPIDDIASAQAASDAAVAAWDAFDDRYLGAKAVAPTLDNDGNALATGAVYWNSTSNKFFVWTGTAWQESLPGTVYTQTDVDDLLTEAVALYMHANFGGL